MVKEKIAPLARIGQVLLTTEILTEPFCCDLDACRGQCCVEGDAGAPVESDEVPMLKKAVRRVWPLLSNTAREVIDRQGVVYIDNDGDTVTSLAEGRDCVFTYHERGRCLCALEKAHEATGEEDRWVKPRSCSLYPLRARRLSMGLTALNYHRWSICRPAVERGQREGIKIYQFLKTPLITIFGKRWYSELEIMGRLIEAAYDKQIK